MHGTLQPGDRSPKQVNIPASTSQSKPGCDSGQNSGTSFPSQAKGKKRERGDHGADHVKRERSSKADDEDSVKCRPITNLKSEIARITEKGGVMDLDGVDKLVQLMQSDRIDRDKELVSRLMLAGVIAATDKVDCLNRFVQLSGLPILDEWLQDVKAKIGDGSSLKEGDKSVENFLSVLLRALDKLPVNLHVLQTCNIGRSVNHLRSHKNIEIQRKARSLVDTWKKRVEAEMISIDTNSGSTQAITVWPSKSRLPEASHAGVSRTLSGSDVAMKSSVTQNSASKIASARSPHGECNVKSGALSPGSLKSTASPGFSKEIQPRASQVVSALDASEIREDRSSSSNQSNQCSPSLSGKDDGKSSSAGIVSKISSSTIRTRKNSGFHGVPVTGSQKETSSSRISSIHKSTTLEKSQPSSNFERVHEGPITELSNHKLVVKISNRARSPAHGATAESVEDPNFTSSRASSPMILDKQEQVDCNSKDKTNLWQNTDSKTLLAGSVEDPGVPAALPDEEQSLVSDDLRKLTNNDPKRINEDQSKSSKLQSPSFSPMNALIESCAKYSEANSSLSLEDDVGMNLLASVAAGETSRFDLVSPTNSAEISIPAVDENSVVDEAKSKTCSETYPSVVKSHFCIGAENDKKHAVSDGNLVSEDELHMPEKVSLKFTAEKEWAPSHASEGIPIGEENIEMESSRMELRRSAHTKWETVGKSNENTDTTSTTFPIYTEKARDGKANEEIQEDLSSNIGANDNSLVTEEKTCTIADVGESKVVGPSQLGEGDLKKDFNEEMNTGANMPQKVTEMVKSEVTEMDNHEKLHLTPHAHTSILECGDELKLGKFDEKSVKNGMCESRKLNSDKEIGMIVDIETQSFASLCSTSTDLKNDTEASAENKIITESYPLEHEAQQNAESKKSKSSSIQLDETQNCDSTVFEATSSATGQTDSDAKIKFDLNEGFNTDDGKYAAPVNLVSSGSTTLQMSNSVSFSVNPSPFGKSTAITVAAAAKGAFVPPEDLGRIKAELGWKGSAATSAFRPAEPRKILETPSGSSPCSDASAGRHGRVPLDIDLNVPDERVLEELACRNSALTVDSADFVGNRPNSMNDTLGSGCLDLDLNRVDEANDITQCSTSSYYRGEGSVAHIKPLGSLPSADVRRDFDLNDGPVGDYAISDHFSSKKQVKGGIPSQLPSAGLRMSSPAMGNFTSWYPPGNTYSTVTVPTLLPDRGDQPFPFFPPVAPQRTFGPIGVAPLTPDVYRGSVLSSSPAVPLSSSSFQFPVFPFGTTFPLPSATFSVGPNSYADSSSGSRLFTPPLNSQFLGPVGSVTSQLQRPFVINIADNSSNNILEINRKWGRQGLDLNAGPGNTESEVREDSFAQHSVASSQAVPEEHTWMYSVPSSLLKRREPEGGWDNENFRYRPFSWE